MRTVTVTIPTAAITAGSWANRKKITIKAAQVSGDQVNFPVLINLASDTGLAASAQTTGGDIYFTSASGVKLAHEIERFQKSTGGLAAWANIPALSSTTDTVIYMYYGNASAADQQNRTAVWDSGYSAVWHMREGSAQHVDSTANANQSQTVSVAASGGTAGQIGMADQFSRAQLSHITIPGSTSLRQPTLTVEAWVKANSTGSGAQDVISFGDDVTLRIEWNGAASFYVYDGGYRWMTGTADLRGGYHHIAGVIDGTAKTLTIYVDGIAQGSVPSSSPAYVHGANVEIGMNAYPSTAYNFDGNIDEARVSKTARSAAWIKTAYTNQSSSTFCAAGAEEKLSTGDKTVPQVAITAPSNGATVSGIVAISATATDNVGVLGVQFSVDGKALGSESTSAPYSSSWNTTGVAAGTHRLSAVARDAAGNRTTSTITVTIAAKPAWQYRKKITIKAAQVSGDQVNFPVLVNLASDTELAASAQTTGGDIYFTSASGAKLAHEIERFQKSTGGLAAWVNIPALSSTTDTVIYMYYGNASAADQQNRTAVWDSGYSAVWHMREGSAQHVDSTVNANQSQTVSVAASGGTAGQIGMADQFSRAQLSHITIPGSTSLRQPTLTVETWVKANSAVSGAQDVISFGDDVTLRIEWNGAASFYVYDRGYRWMTGTADLRGDTITSPGSSTGQRKRSRSTWMVSLKAQFLRSSPAYVHGANVEIGMNAYPSTAYNFDGNIDEARKVKTARSASWIKTAYTNQSSTASFYTVG